MKPIPLPDPIKESQVKIRLSWKADRRTRKAILRQAQLMGSKDPTDYLCQLVACGLESNESMSVVLPNGELVCMSEGFKQRLTNKTRQGGELASLFCKEVKYYSIWMTANRWVNQV